MLTPEQSVAIERVRRCAVTEIATELTHAYQPAPASERFDAFTTLAESMARRQCQFLNSLYLYAASKTSPVSRIEKNNSDLARRNLSFGDYVATIDLFLQHIVADALPANAGLLWTTKIVQLRTVALSQEAARLVASFEILKQAREKYQVPVERLERYLEDHLTGTSKRVVALDVFKMVNHYRNAKAHHHPWFLFGDQKWNELLVGRLELLFLELLLHPPIHIYLTDLEVVRLLENSKPTGSSRHRAAATRDEVHELFRPLAETPLLSSEGLSLGRHWAHRTDQEPKLEWLVPWRDFPENAEPPAVREQRYRLEVLLLYLDTGALRSVDREGRLRVKGGEIGFDDAVTRRLEDEVVEAARQAEEELRGKEPIGAITRLEELLGRFTSEVKDLHNRLITLDDERAKVLHLAIADQYPISLNELQSATSMHPVDLERVLQRLVSGVEPSRIVRKVEPVARRVYFRIPSQLGTDARLSVAMKSLALLKRIPTYVSPLLEVCQQFFSDDGHPSLPQEIRELLAKKESSSSGVSDELVQRLRFVANGVDVVASSVPELFRNVMHRFGNVGALFNALPFATGPRRFLVARAAQHPSGRPFNSELWIDDLKLVFEANQSRLSALSGLRAWFSQSGLFVERAEIDGASIDEIQVKVTAPQVLDLDLFDEFEFVEDEGLPRIEVSIDGRTQEVVGRTVGDFLRRVVALLVDEGKFDVSLLPIKIGRVRCLVAQDPKHANGRNFDSPLEYDGMFIETAFSRAEARSYAAVMCKAFDVEVVDKRPA